jgi:hypothetical protein
MQDTYGPCGSCGPDEGEIDFPPHCMCAPHCGEGLPDCPDPGTGADPACAIEIGLCVLLCDAPEQCPEGMQFPDPRELPEGAQGYCYYP